MKYSFKRSLAILFVLTALFTLSSCTANTAADDVSRDIISIAIDTAEYNENGIIKLTMNNNSAGEFSYNENYVLFRFKDGKWQPVPFVDTAFHEVTRTLDAGESTRNNINLNVRHGELLAGKYLIIREGEIKVLYSTDDGVIEHVFTTAASGTFEISEATDTASE